MRFVRGRDRSGKVLPGVRISGAGRAKEMRRMRLCLRVASEVLSGVRLEVLIGTRPPQCRVHLGTASLGLVPVGLDYDAPVDEILPFILVGFFAQTIDGVLGMAYGVSATSFMLSLGVSPAVASASVHAAELFTTGLSGLSHYGFGNVDRVLVRRLMIPGMLGAITGAWLLVSLPGDRIKPFIAGYLLIMGLLILSKARADHPHREVRSHLVPLGLAGGFFDTIGGGGWGPIVVGTLLARGNHPRFTIGSVNFAEFFVTLAASLTFVLTIGFSQWRPIAGLAIGGAIAAPFAAWAARRVPARPLLVFVGLLVIALSIRTIILTVG